MTPVAAVVLAAMIAAAMVLAVTRNYTEMYSAQKSSQAPTRRPRSTAPTHTQQNSQERMLALLLGPTRPTTHNHTDFTMDDLPIEDLHKQLTQIARDAPKVCDNPLRADTAPEWKQQRT
jgi:hypothetical protein